MAFINYKLKSIVIALTLSIVCLHILVIITQEKTVIVVKIPDNELIIGDNITGYPVNVVPNLVHYVLFGIHQIHFSHYISLLSVIRNQKPNKIMIHCDCDHLSGNYWQIIEKLAKNANISIVVKRVEKPIEIFGQKLNKIWLNWHSSDIMRNLVLQEYGGIYLDRDVYVVKSLDVFRKFEMTVGWDEGQYMGSQIQIAHKSARFLKLYYETYRHYDPNSWYYNAGELPTKSILHKFPHLVHRVINKFGIDGPVVCPKIYSEYYPNWQKDFYTIHLVLRGNEIELKGWCFGDESKYPPIMKFNETIASKLDVTFGEMTRMVIPTQ